MYQAEGIVSMTLCSLTMPIIHLVGDKSGILHALDEEIKVRGSSKGFFNKLVKRFSGDKAHLTFAQTRELHSRQALCR